MAETLERQGAMSEAEVAAYIDQLQERGNAHFRELVIEHRFTQEMREGRLSRPRLKGFIGNWFTFAWEINAIIAASYYRYLPFLKANMSVHDILADKIGDELMHPGPGGHIKTLFPVGAAVGLSEEEMIKTRLIPEARALVDYHVRIFQDGPVAEAFASSLKEGMVGQWLGIFYEAMERHYGFSRAQSDYFRMHHEADNEPHEGVIAHDEANKHVLKQAILSGEAFRRPDFDPAYALATGIEMYGIFLDGIYKRFPG
jgi:pyrroloquinoline quinone (PQQ) biosynthesis protein C